MKLFKKVLCVDLMIVALMIGSSFVYAKRTAAPQVPSVAYQGISYRAAYSKGGIIEAHNSKTDQLLWSQQIYPVVYKPNIETDVQDVFIKKIKLKQGNLLIIDEKNRAYLLGLKNRKVSVVNTKKHSCHCSQ